MHGKKIPAGNKWFVLICFYFPFCDRLVSTAFINAHLKYTLNPSKSWQNMQTADSSNVVTEMHVLVAVVLQLTVR